MQYRPLGKSGIEASIVGLGAAAIGGSDSQVTPDDRESVRAIHAALDAGVTLIDTAPSYGWGIVVSTCVIAMRNPWLYSST